MLFRSALHVGAHAVRVHEDAAQLCHRGWNCGGGGFSDTFAIPSYQADAVAHYKSTATLPPVTAPTAHTMKPTVA